MIKNIAGRVFRPLFALLLVATVALPVSFATAVAGIKASMPAVIQTTMVTGLTALRNSLTLRASTSNEPPLSPSRLPA